MLIFGINAAISTKKLDEAKRRIREFTWALMNFLQVDDEEGNTCDEVYRLNVQFFPLTRVSGLVKNPSDDDSG